MRQTTVARQSCRGARSITPWPRGSEAVTRYHLALTVVDFPENEAWGLAASRAKSLFL
jgi:hypothetical protein